MAKGTIYLTPSSIVGMINDMNTTKRLPKRELDRLMRELDNLAVLQVFTPAAAAIRDALMADIRATIALSGK